MSSSAEFDFEDMRAQGEAAGVQVLYLLTMTPLPVAGPQPAVSSALEAHYAYMHRVIADGKVLVIGPCTNDPAIPGEVPVLELDGRTHVVTVAELHGQQREGARQQIVAANDRFARYQEKTDRQLPVIRLTARN